MPVTLDRATIDTNGNGNPHNVQVVRRHGDHLVEVLDAYPSKPQAIGTDGSAKETP